LIQRDGFVDFLVDKLFEFSLILDIFGDRQHSFIEGSFDVFHPVILPVVVAEYLGHLIAQLGLLPEELPGPGPGQRVLILPVDGRHRDEVDARGILAEETRRVHARHHVHAKGEGNQVLVGPGDEEAEGGRGRPGER